MTEFTKQLQHLIALAKTPGFKQYAWQRSLELERCETGLWAGMAQALTAAMQAKAVTA